MDRNSSDVFILVPKTNDNTRETSAVPCSSVSSHSEPQTYIRVENNSPSQALSEENPKSAESLDLIARVNTQNSHDNYTKKLEMECIDQIIHDDYSGTKLFSLKIAVWKIIFWIKAYIALGLALSGLYYL